MGFFGAMKKLVVTAAVASAIAYAGDAYDTKPRIDALLNRPIETVQLQKYTANGRESTYVSYYDGKTRAEVPITKGEFGIIIGDPTQAWQNLSEQQKTQYFLQQWQNMPQQEKGTIVIGAFEQLPLEERAKMLMSSWNTLDSAARNSMMKQELEYALNSYYGGEGK